MWTENETHSVEEPFRLTCLQRHISDAGVLTPGCPTAARGINTSWHCHPEMELAVVTAGAGLCYVGDYTAPFAAPECFLLGVGLPHCWIEEEECTGYVLHFLFPPDCGIWRLGCEMELHRLLESARRGLRFGGVVASEVTSLLDRLDGGARLARAGLLLELFSLLQNAIQRGATQLSCTEYGGLPGHAISGALEATVKWMMDNFTEPITLDEALGRAGMSPATFSRQFKRHTGKTFVEFLNDIRLAYAHQRLTSSRRSVAEIAFESGFNSLSHFGVLFRNRFGITPREVQANSIASARVRDRYGRMSVTFSATEYDECNDTGLKRTTEDLERAVASASGGMAKSKQSQRAYARTIMGSSD